MWVRQAAPGKMEKLDNHARAGAAVSSLSMMGWWREGAEWLSEFRRRRLF